MSLFLEDASKIELIILYPVKALGCKQILGIGVICSGFEYCFLNVTQPQIECIALRQALFHTQREQL